MPKTSKKDRKIQEQEALERKKLEEQNYELFEELKTGPNFVSFEKLLSSSLIESKLEIRGAFASELVNKLEQAIFKKQDIVFRSFVITFNLNLRYSLTKLVPIISLKESSNVEAVNLSKSDDEAIANFLNIFNEKINSLLNQKKCLEIVNNMIIFISQETKSLKITFSKELI